jgi:hypothetical protein
MTRYRGDNIPSISDYSHWNEDAARVWYEENKYDMQHWDEPVELDPYDNFYFEDDEIPEAVCFERFKHQQNTSGRTILFAGIEVYDQSSAMIVGSRLASTGRKA